MEHRWRIRVRRVLRSAGAVVVATMGPVVAAIGLVVSAEVVAGQSAPVSVTGGVTTVGQWASDDSARAEVVSSVDLFVEWETGPVSLFAYVEANTTPFLNGVSRRIGEANTDAGTALNQRRRGRVQLSELRLVLPAGSWTGHAGLLDASGFIDVSRIANDENLFFLGVPFVNNPTIEFPDYALGVAFEGRGVGHPELRVGGVVTSSHGLADNPAVSYAQLLDLQHGGKGVFAGGAVRWVGPGHRLSLGAWINSAEHPRLDLGGTTESNKGVFAVAGLHGSAHSISGRVGLSNGDVSVARAFAGVTYLGTYRANAIGAAVGRSVPSTLDATLESVTHGELFLRRRFWRGVFVTGSSQRIVHPGFARRVGPIAAVWVFGLRLSAQF